MISGQHTVKALLELRRTWIKAEKPIPQWLEVVNAKVLRPETPVHCRQLFAGDEQYRQSQTVQLKLSDLASHLLGSEEVTKDNVSWRRLGLALRKCGFERADTPV